ncbi:Ribonuclease G/E [Caulobacter ginsengisoli]|uniref:Ribonuclease G/E n=1 Tax=Caulobacter ginsengisoli TaxID=400775 RepID=A0ABU0IMI9_9CAUL|nr:ribonuclease E/G [Caulobacter ginsengisoli]MDQ0462601.1 Ribonuclease G/E [Caulobacter ginsengisoli]
MTRKLFLDRGIGQTRGVVTLDGRPEYLLIERDGGDPATTLGAVGVGRVRKVERAFASAFVELAGGAEGLLPLKPEMERIVEGQAVTVAIKSEPRAGKAATLSLVGPGEGAPRVTSPALGIAAELRAIGKTDTITEGPAARRAADLAEAQALETVHGLPGGGSIAIETTRALTAVDVDLGERPGHEAKRAARAANLAALSEAARLLRLKGLGGLVVFDLVGRGHDGTALLNAARVAFGPDNPGVAIGAISRFGTMELTVPRRRAPVLEILREDSTRALALARALEAADPGARLTARCSPGVAAAFKTFEAAVADKLGARFVVEARGDYAPERFEVFAS